MEDHRGDVSVQEVPAGGGDYLLLKLQIFSAGGAGVSLTLDFSFTLPLICLCTPVIATR